MVITIKSCEQPWKLACPPKTISAHGSHVRKTKITTVTGSRYDHNAASPNLYAYLRNLTIDANGHLVAIGPESRVVIDTPEECP